MTVEKEQLSRQIAALVDEYYRVAHQRPEFIPGESKVPYAGRVFDEKEMLAGVRSVLDFWLTAGPECAALEQRFREFFGAREALLVNSGSSANLLMVATLRSDNLRDGLSAGDEVITPAATFPTTLTPIVQNGLVPVFVDVGVDSLNIDTTQLEAALSEKTRCLFIPHTLGVPCDVDEVQRVAEKHNLWLLEDGCDALGATWNGRKVGSFGAMSSVSFYPAHHMTMGEGGLTVVNDVRLKRTAASIRDWGRDCWCGPGESNTCGKRFGWTLGELPTGYDHKYIYSNLGYNLKLTEMQAAIGLAQLDKIEDFVAARRDNANYYKGALREHAEHLILPHVPAQANPSWYSYPLTVRPHVNRARLIRWLEQSKIETRTIFAGNILRQPGFARIQHRVHGELTRTDDVMNHTFFIGVYPGLTQTMREYVAERIGEFFRTQV